ncbi:alpha/beta fold hydrolase [Ornithinimicrobium sufpigmenti]|uniref:alpha/beta fold hydrolase n=1 Tax=Ornithinimicrobium sufpigmenti TaxID=2508882 RepID=UPI0015E1B908|nr:MULTISPECIES: alpha/beta fold hydrolase [unclassified Ornithinimicrobium]
MPAVPVQTWGSGARAVLVHGSLATGPLEWDAQRPLAEEGYQLVVPTRRAYATAGSGHPLDLGEDFLADGQDIAGLLGDGAHLVGHSYGALVALVAAHERPEAVHSLVLAEPPLFDATDHPAAAALQEGLVQLLARPVGDREFLTDFLRLVGTDAADLPSELVEELSAMTPALRGARQPWETPLPTAELVAADFPTVVVSGAHHPGFTAVCEALAELLGAQHQVVAGAGHEVQLAAEAFNAVLLRLWRSTEDGPT